MKKRIYSKEFKEPTVRLSYQRDNIKELADELGLDPQRIYKWRKGAKSVQGPKQHNSNCFVLRCKNISKNIMKSRIEILVIMLVIIMSSCSDSKIQITTKNNFEIVKLPDGSTAYLNSNSYIEYDKNFVRRVVKQRGEVFYDVTKGEYPFFVKTEIGEIQVLGTRFNVISNKDELEVEVEEGVVELKINEFISKVKKGQKAFFKESESEIKMYKAKFKHKKWIKNLNREFKKLGIEIGKSFKQIEKESKKSWKEINKELEK